MAFHLGPLDDGKASPAQPSSSERSLSLIPLRGERPGTRLSEKVLGKRRTGAKGKGSLRSVESKRERKPKPKPSPGIREEDLTQTPHQRVGQLLGDIPDADPFVQATVVEIFDTLMESSLILPEEAFSAGEQAFSTSSTGALASIELCEQVASVGEIFLTVFRDAVVAKHAYEIFKKDGGQVAQLEEKMDAIREKISPQLKRRKELQEELKTATGAKEEQLQAELEQLEAELKKPTEAFNQLAKNRKKLIHDTIIRLTGAGLNNIFRAGSTMSAFAPAAAQASGMTVIGGAAGLATAGITIYLLAQALKKEGAISDAVHTELEAIAKVLDSPDASTGTKYIAHLRCLRLLSTLEDSMLTRAIYQAATVGTIATSIGTTLLSIGQVIAIGTLGTAFAGATAATGFGIILVGLLTGAGFLTYKNWDRITLKTREIATSILVGHEKRNLKSLKEEKEALAAKLKARTVTKADTRARLKERSPAEEAKDLVKKLKQQIDANNRALAERALALKLEENSKLSESMQALMAKIEKDAELMEHYDQLYTKLRETERNPKTELGQLRRSYEAHRAAVKKLRTRIRRHDVQVAEQVAVIAETEARKHWLQREFQAASLARKLKGIEKEDIPNIAMTLGTILDSGSEREIIKDYLASTYPKFDATAYDGNPLKCIIDAVSETPIVASSSH